MVVDDLLCFRRGLEHTSYLDSFKYHMIMPNCYPITDPIIAYYHSKESNMSTLHVLAALEGITGS